MPHSLRMWSKSWDKLLYFLLKEQFALKWRLCLYSLTFMFCSRPVCCFHSVQHMRRNLCSLGLSSPKKDKKCMASEDVTNGTQVVLTTFIMFFFWLFLEFVRCYHHELPLYTTIISFWNHFIKLLFLFVVVIDYYW